MATKFNLKDLTPDEILYLRAKETYYIGEPIIDDVEFDTLEDQLRQIDSIVVDIVGQVKITKDKVNFTKGKNKFIPHITPMGSLAKIQFKPNYVPFNEFTAWLHKSTDQTIKLEAGPKLDGNAINLIYDNGVLQSVTSRGDGIEGQDYTAQFSNNVPKYIKNFTGEIRGEAVIDTYLFETTYGENSNTDGKKYANPRNFVAGCLTKGDARCADIDFVAFQIVNFVGDTQTQLVKWGFNVLDFIKIYDFSELTNITNFEKMYADFKYYRDNCKYQLDGIVIKMQESIREEIGGNNHHPFWALAIKFITQEVTTTIKDIVWTLGKNGQLSPVAILEPVILLGTEVKRASVYNASWLLDKKCYPGAVISIIKSGDIIPKLVSIISESTETFELPTIWENNNTIFDGVQLMVDNFQDTDQFKALKLHNAVVAIGINGIGPATAEKLVNAGIELVDLFTHNPIGLKIKLINSGQFKDGRDLEILINNIFELTSVELWQIIYAMNFRNCGRTISKQLANWMSNIQYDFKGLEKTVVEDFINDSIAQESVKELVGYMLATNINVIKPKQLDNSIILFEMTGDVSGWANKGEFKREIEATGKAIHSSLNKNTTYLVTNTLASMTTKMQKAQKNGTKIVTYEEFSNYIKSL